MRIHFRSSGSCLVVLISKETLPQGPLSASASAQNPEPSSLEPPPPPVSCSGSGYGEMEADFLDMRPWG